LVDRLQKAIWRLNIERLIVGQSKAATIASRLPLCDAGAFA